ncbi:MAG TPA: hypothetical protein PK095_13935 [Myxococcota bacterium]|nr:hypothetical protein [Myxococcota bacterium]
MPRGLIIDLAGRTTRFDLQVVNRAKLYGEKKKLVVDERGEPTTAGWLTIDSGQLIGPGGRAELYLDDQGDIIPRDSLAALSPDGRLMERLPSTLDTPQPATLVAPEVLLDFVTTNVYALTPDEAELDATTLAELEAGAILQTAFSYMPGYNRAPLFILKNEEGLFALVAEPAPLDPLGRNTPPTPPESAEPDDDDLDFSMF